MGRKKKQVIFEPKLDGYIETGKKKRYATYSSGAEQYGMGKESRCNNQSKKMDYR